MISGSHEAFEQNRHNQEDDHERQQQIDLQGIPGLGELVGCTGHRQADARRHAFRLDRSDNLRAHDFERRLERQVGGRADFQGDCPQAFAVPDGHRPGGQLDIGEGGNRDDAPVRSHHRVA